MTETDTVIRFEGPNWLSVWTKTHPRNFRVPKNGIPSHPRIHLARFAAVPLSYPLHVSNSAAASSSTCARLHFRGRGRERMIPSPDTPNPNTWARDEKPDFIRGNVVIKAQHIPEDWHFKNMKLRVEILALKRLCRVCQQNFRVQGHRMIRCNE